MFHYLKITELNSILLNKTNVTDILLRVAIYIQLTLLMINLFSSKYFLFFFI